MSAVPARTRDLRFLVACIAVALALAGLVAYHASEEPDGLERVAADHGVDAAAADHALSGSPVADYELRGMGEGRAAVGLAGIAGVLLTLAVAAGVLALLRPGRG